MKQATIVVQDLEWLSMTKPGEYQTANQTAEWRNVNTAAWPCDVSWLFADVRRDVGASRSRVTLTTGRCFE